MSRQTRMTPGSRKKIAEFFGRHDEICLYQNSLVQWFQQWGRDYPWRRTSDSYAILVSETMLQQTQIATVLDREYFTRWMQAFPTWRDLAEASEEAVLKQWEGLGYYTRARNLHQAAIIVSREYEGKLPEDFATILSLPGVGRYTAGAVMSFAFDRKAAIVDANVTRVLARLFAWNEVIDTSESRDRIWEWAEFLTPAIHPRLYNSAIMELGQRVCTRQNPSCPSCPVKSWCRALEHENVEKIPVKSKRPAITYREERVVLAIRNRQVLLCPESGTRRKGLWRLPEVSALESANWAELFRFDYTITRYRVTLRVFHLPPDQDGAESIPIGCIWFPGENEDNLPPLGSPYRKVLRMMAESGGDTPPSE